MSATENGATFRRLAVRGSTLWLAGHVTRDFQVERMFAWRFDARDGARTEIELDLPGRELGSFVPGDDVLWAMVYNPFDPARPEVQFEAQLVSFDLDGRVQWNHRIQVGPWLAEEPGWYRHSVEVEADSEVWVESTQSWYGGPSQTDAEFYRMHFERWTPSGERIGVFDHAFESVEPGAQDIDPADGERGACEDYESTVFGTRTLRSFDLGEQLMVAGLQDCRDSFVTKVAIQ